MPTLGKLGWAQLKQCLMLLVFDETLAQYGVPGGLRHAASRPSGPRPISSHVADPVFCQLFRLDSPAVSVPLFSLGRQKLAASKQQHTSLLQPNTHFCCLLCTVSSLLVIPACEGSSTLILPPLLCIHDHLNRDSNSDPIYYSLC